MQPDAPAGGIDAPANGCVVQVPSTQIGDGHHNPGIDCMNGCHNHGFTVSGTLFASATGTTPVTGATIKLVDANNQTVTVISQANGNFYTTTPVTFPITVLATSCPNIQHMSASVQGTNSAVGCNKNGCHTGVGTPGWVHLP